MNKHSRTTRRRGSIAAFLPVAILGATLAHARDVPQPAPDLSTKAEPDYLDDRSTPESVVRSLYNAISRKEFPRAWSYFRDEPDRPSFADFARGYAATAAVDVRIGRGSSDGAAGSIYYTLPVAIRSVTAGDKRQVFTGCYELRLVQPGAQVEPPFRPLGIVRGRLVATDAAFDTAMGRCPAEGLQ